MTARRLSTIFAVLAALLLAPTAAHAADERAAAQRFADAVLRGKVAIRAQVPEIEQRFENLGTDQCERALVGAPAHAEDEVFAIIVSATTWALVDPAMPALRQIVADLSAIPTEDAALRSGRAAWRRSVEMFESIPRVADPCGTLEAWKRKRWRRDAAPKISFRQFEELIDGPSARRVERKLRRAAQRMRQLGVSRGAAERFRGETLFDDVDPFAGPTIGEEFRAR